MNFGRLVHKPTRLQVFAYLYRHGETGFSDLVEELDLTEGALASPLQRMDEAGAVAVHREFVDRKPRTTHELTEEGCELFEEHTETLETLVDDLDREGPAGPPDVDCQSVRRRLLVRQTSIAGPSGVGGPPVRAPTSRSRPDTRR